MPLDLTDRRTLVSQARGHLQQRRPREAEGLLRACVAADANDVEALELLGISRFHQSDPAEAAILLHSACRLAPDRSSIANTLGAVLLASGDAAGALAAFERAIEGTPDYGVAWNNRGNALSALGRPADALAAYQRAAALMPQDANVAVALGQTLLGLDRPLEALAEYERALALAPAHVAAQRSLAMVRHRVILHTLTPAHHAEPGVRAGVTLFADGSYDSAARLLEECADDSGGSAALAATAHHFAGNHGEAQRLFATVPAGDKRTAADVLMAEFQPRVEAAIALRGYRERIFDPDRDTRPAAPDGRQRVHLVAQLAQRAGTEMRTLGLATQLRADADVTIWANGGNIHPDFAGEGIRAIGDDVGAAPTDGTLVLIGAWQPLGAWYARGRFRRVVVVYNVDNPVHLARTLGILCRPGAPKVELLFACQWLQDGVGLPGTVQWSPIDPERFVPAMSAKHAGDFVVGRHSRDDQYKFHPDAAAWYARLAARGIRVRLMGATALSTRLSGLPGIELLPTGAEPAYQFLQQLDCFVYRTHPYFRETWGRVVSEAMACALPVVVHRSGGYAEIIDHGRNGFLFDRDEEADAIIDELRADPELRRRVGTAARQTVEATLGDASRLANSRYYRL